MDIAALSAQLADDEGVRLVAYDDATGKPLTPGDTLVGNVTVGVGRNLTTRGLSRSEVEMLLRNDIMSVTTDLNTALPWWKRLSEPRQRALANLCFNLGLPVLLTFKRFLAALAAGAYGTAAEELRASRWSAQVGARSQRIADVIRRG